MAACFGRLEPPRRAHEKRGLQFGFKAGDLLADDGFRDAKPLGCPGKRACVDDRSKIGEAVEVDWFHGTPSV